jgi:hypothetical protein
MTRPVIKCMKYMGMNCADLALTLNGQLLNIVTIKEQQVDYAEYDLIPIHLKSSPLI